MKQEGGYRPIAEYGIIGDCRSAGLVARDGSLDWLCLPRFDSPSIFAAILDAHLGGRFHIRPVAAYDSERRYVPGTNVLETTFRTQGGRLVLRDLMPVAAEEDKRKALTPEHQVLRQLHCLDGEVDVEVLYQPRPNYGRGSPRLRQWGKLGIHCEAPPGVLILTSELPLAISPGGQAAVGRALLRAGERKHVSLSYTQEAPAVVPALGDQAQQKVERSIEWWQKWAARCCYEGPYRDAVVRSLLTLKLMAYAPSGAVVAAPTTSLPERLGGVRNWDYRYCWLRDASFTLRALFALGYHEEADAFLSWMLHATRLNWPRLHIVYDVFGRADLAEKELGHLHGYQESRPVRIGNDAHSQLQMDVYGEVIDASALFMKQRTGRFDRETTSMLNGWGHTVCERWTDPDEGIWEGRSGRAHHTHSKVLCWVALDRLIQLHDAGHPELSVERFRANRDALRLEIEARAYNEELHTYTQTYEGREVDASLLLLPLYGYVPADHPRMRSTLERIRQQLAKGALVYRYRPTDGDGLPPGEGAFGICGFWLVEALARSGEPDAARRAFEELLECGNDLGLYGEETDPDTRQQLGNFPQAFTHIGLINAALTLQECEGQAVPKPTTAKQEDQILEVPA